MAMESPGKKRDASRLNEKPPKNGRELRLLRGMCQPRTAGTYVYVSGPLPWNLKEPCARLPLVAVICEERQMAVPVRISVIGKPPIVMSLSSSWRVKD